jgi:hypothetical protein
VLHGHRGLLLHLSFIAFLFLFASYGVNHGECAQNSGDSLYVKHVEA